MTLAASTGPLWLLLLFHVMGGAIALVAGFAAVAAAKGGQWHRKAGLVFVVSMIVMGVFASIVGAFELRTTAVGGVFTVYLVFTGLTTVRPLAGTWRTQHVVLMTLAFLVAAFQFTAGTIVMGMPHAMYKGVPAAMMLFIGTIALLAGIGDFRMIRAGSMQGTRKLARHLWRMCFALFIASGSFFFGQTKFVPSPLRIVPILSALGVAPLIVLLYWMWRVRLRHSLRGMTLRIAREAH